ncbi:hypothetical protein OJAV_G00051530 [Oryzias javanicus]|uniref:Uncharacterized protein n=1 Tax=Oryzias javanicus TaxID=123683 RepID=A0A437D9G7_ORYJA|nr:hypothetical protein OJAV_G00051530 [Oryzias javanicus]
MAAGFLISRLLLVFLMSEVKFSSVFPSSGVLASPERQTVPELTSNESDQPNKAQISPLLKLVKGVLKHSSNTNVYDQPMIQHHQEPQQTDRAIKWIADVFKSKDNSFETSRNLLRNTEATPTVYSQPSMYQHPQDPYQLQTEHPVEWLRPKEDYAVESTAPQSSGRVDSIIKSLIGTSDTTADAEPPTLQDQDDFGSAHWPEYSDVFSYPHQEMPTYDPHYPNVHLDVSLPFAPPMPYEPWNLQRLIGMINPLKQGLLQTGVGQSLLFNSARPLPFNANPAYPFRQQYPCPNARMSMYHPAHFQQQTPSYWPPLPHGQRQYYHPHHSSPYHFPLQLQPRHHFAPHPSHYGRYYHAPQEHNRRMFMR